MAGKGVQFSHHDMPTLVLRLPPTEVSWTYNLNTNVVDTVAGQIVQILSVNFDNITIKGRFGREGPHGAEYTRNDQGHIVLRDRTKGFRDISTPATNDDPYRIGLTQMTEWFQRYFQLASQGGKKNSGLYGHYNPFVVHLRYSIDDANDALAQGIQQDGEWKVYPTSMPSFKRSNEDFAPEWEVKCEVVEPDFALKRVAVDTELARLKDIHFGYVPFNPFSDPLGGQLGDKFLVDYRNGKLTPSQVQKAQTLAKERLTSINSRVWDSWRTMMPAMDEGDLQEMIFFGTSKPLTSALDLRTSLPKTTAPSGKGKQLKGAKAGLVGINTHITQPGT